MAKPIKSKRPQRKEITFPLDKSNIMIICVGILLLIIGYIFLAENSVDGFLPTTVAPILLVLGYCVVIPYGIIRKPKQKREEVPAAVTPPQNIKTS
jgi:hypothetical protein